MRVEYSHRFQRAASRSPRDAPDHLSGWLTLHSKDRFKTNVIMSFGFQFRITWITSRTAKDDWQISWIILNDPKCRQVSLTRFSQVTVLPPLLKYLLWTATEPVHVQVQQKASGCETCHLESDFRRQIDIQQQMLFHYVPVKKQCLYILMGYFMG